LEDENMFAIARHLTGGVFIGAISCIHKYPKANKKTQIGGETIPFVMVFEEE